MSDKLAAQESWKKMVLRAMPTPAWLTEDAQDNDIVISSRYRIARNLSQFPFPHSCELVELKRIQNLIIQAAATQNLKLHEKCSEAERDFLIGCRLIDPEFEIGKTGRALLLNGERSLSIMINEEDHLRIQGLTAGWSINQSKVIVKNINKILAQTLTYSNAEPWGFLTSSTSNSGKATRASALFHLIGLAHTKRIGQVLKAMNNMGIVTRGLFGEASRAVGAFFQVSVTTDELPIFVGASDYLIKEERMARMQLSQGEIWAKSLQAVKFAVGSREIDLADSLRVLAWVRWAAASGIQDFPFPHRQVDYWISTLEVRGSQDPQKANQDRANTLRQYFDPVLFK